MNLYLLRNDQLKGNIVDWNNSEWDATNMHKLEINKSVLCKSNLGPVLIPTRMPQKVSYQFCQKLNSDYFTLANDEKVNLAQEMMKDKQRCDGIWTGWTDELKEGNFYDVNNDSIELSTTNFNKPIWAAYEPNGGTESNCVSFGVWQSGSFGDVQCSKRFCGICDLPYFPVFKMRGQRLTSNYGWTGNLIGNFLIAMIIKMM